MPKVLARAHHELPLAGGSTVTRHLAVAVEALAQERLVHHPEYGLSESRQCDQRAPSGHAGYERFGAVDRIQHPYIFGVRMLVAVFLTDDAVTGKRAAYQRPHRRLGGAVGGSHWVERASRVL